MAIKLEYALQESVQNMRRNMFMTLAAVLVVTVSLFLFGAVFLLRNAIQRSADLVTRKVEVAVFLSADISADQREALKRELSDLPVVRTVIYESKQQAYDHFRDLYRNEPEVVANVTPDALPDSFRVSLKDPTRFAEIKDRFEGRPGINTIRDERDTLQTLFSTTKALRSAGFFMALVVGLAALALIATTIRMAIFARRKEIGIMKLVGATNWFVRVPFMLEGVAEGIVGAVLAVLMLLPSRGVLSSFGPSQLASEQLRFVVTSTDILLYGGFAVVIGMLLGAAGSLAGLRRFLDV